MKEMLDSLWNQGKTNMADTAYFIYHCLRYITNETQLYQSGPMSLDWLVSGNTLNVIYSESSIINMEKHTVAIRPLFLPKSN